MSGPTLRANASLNGTAMVVVYFCVQQLRIERKIKGHFPAAKTSWSTSAMLACDCQTTVQHKLNRESVQLQIVSVLGAFGAVLRTRPASFSSCPPFLEHVQGAEEAVIADHACLRPSHCHAPLQRVFAMIFISLLAMGAAPASPIGLRLSRRGLLVMP